jgi:uncharacterized membrane protein YhdT
MKGAGPFRGAFTRAMASAGLAFGLVHAIQSIAKGFVAQTSFKFDPSGLIVLVPYELIQSAIFIFVGWIIAYIPSRMLADFMERRHSGQPIWFIACGIFMGLLFLPICASFPFFLFRTTDEPSYLARCLEFALPMVVAGAVGGAVFLRSTTYSRSAPR